MSAPIVRGVAALLLEEKPNLTIDQVKYRLINTDLGIGSVECLKAYEIVTGTSTSSVNIGLLINLLLAAGKEANNFSCVDCN